MWHLFHSCFLVQYLQVLSQRLVHKPLPPEMGQSAPGCMSDGGCKPWVYKVSKILLFVPWYNSCNAGSSSCLVIKYFLYSSWHRERTSFLMAFTPSTQGAPLWKGPEASNFDRISHPFALVNSTGDRWYEAFAVGRASCLHQQGCVNRRVWPQQ